MAFRRAIEHPTAAECMRTNASTASDTFGNTQDHTADANMTSLSIR